jgi:hypothetical protein
MSWRGGRPPLCFKRGWFHKVERFAPVRLTTPIFGLSGEPDRDGVIGRDRLERRLSQQRPRPSPVVPGHVRKSEAIRSQFSHVNDIAPTIYDAIGLSLPKTVNGVEQKPTEGKSLIASFSDPSVKSQHTEQYFEIFGNRAIYRDGWVAGARRYAPSEIFTNLAKIFRGGFEKDLWELYNVAEDFSEAHDLADKFPEKLAEPKVV